MPVSLTGFAMLSPRGRQERGARKVFQVSLTLLCSLSEPPARISHVTAVEQGLAPSPGCTELGLKGPDTLSSVLIG